MNCFESRRADIRKFIGDYLSSMCHPAALWVKKKLWEKQKVAYCSPDNCRLPSEETVGGRLKMQDWKMADESAGLENAGLENDGRKCRAGK